MPDPAHEIQGRVLTVAGSDSSGGAGVEADIRTFRDLSSPCEQVVTCHTVQSDREVRSITPREPADIAADIERITRTFNVTALKTGMLYSIPIIRAVSAAVRGIPNLIVDPVMVSTSGTRLLVEEAVPVLCEELLPLAVLVTPNLDEAEVLCGFRVDSVESMEAAAREINSRYTASCLLKGGHLSEGNAVDLLCVGGAITVFSSQRIETGNVRGTGCMLSAAITAHLSQGRTLAESVAEARSYVLKQIIRG